MSDHARDDRARLADRRILGWDRKGFPRLSDSRDWERREIELSLDADNVVIPVYMNGAELPSENWLASCGLERLFGRQSVRLNNDDYGFT